MTTDELIKKAESLETLLRDENRSGNRWQTADVMRDLIAALKEQVAENERLRSEATDLRLRLAEALGDLEQARIYVKRISFDGGGQ